MSSIAVFLVLGGATALAAGLAKNSVGTKQLKNNAVTTKKIKKNAVTGAKVKESTLGTVPSASSLTPPEATHIVGAPGEPPFEGGSTNISSGPRWHRPPARDRRSWSGRLCLHSACWLPPGLGETARA
jgi:hypothetical protein